MPRNTEEIEKDLLLTNIRHMLAKMYFTPKDITLEDLITIKLILLKGET